MLVKMANELANKLVAKIIELYKVSYIQCSKTEYLKLMKSIEENKYALFTNCRDQLMNKIKENFTENEIANIYDLLSLINTIYNAYLENLVPELIMMGYYDLIKVMCTIKSKTNLELFVHILLCEGDTSGTNYTATLTGEIELSSSTLRKELCDTNFLNHVKDLLMDPIFKKWCRENFDCRCIPYYTLGDTYVLSYNRSYHLYNFCKKSYDKNCKFLIFKIIYNDKLFKMVDSNPDVLMEWAHIFISRTLSSNPKEIIPFIEWVVNFYDKYDYKILEIFDNKTYRSYNRENFFKVLMGVYMCSKKYPAQYARIISKYKRFLEIGSRVKLTVIYQFLNDYRKGMREIEKIYLIKRLIKYMNNITESYGISKYLAFICDNYNTTLSADELYVVAVEKGAYIQNLNSLNGDRINNSLEFLAGLFDVFEDVSAIYKLISVSNKVRNFNKRLTEGYGGEGYSSPTIKDKIEAAEKNTLRSKQEENIRVLKRINIKEEDIYRNLNPEVYSSACTSDILSAISECYGSAIDVTLIDFSGDHEKLSIFEYGYGV